MRAFIKKRGQPRLLASYIKLGQSSDSAMIRALGLRALKTLVRIGERSKGRRKEVASGKRE